ncbi:ribonuclease III [Auricularia subglabra TFB-10046 SS5]|nr:ribonuclease III [Auricularia subglabra TFB-10046 SS5]
MLSLWQKTAHDGTENAQSATRKLDDVDSADPDPRPAKRSRHETGDAPVLSSYVPVGEATTAGHGVPESDSGLVEHAKRVNALVAFDNWKSFSEVAKALVQHYIAVEVDFGFRPTSPGARIPVYVTTNLEDMPRTAQSLSTAIGIRVGASHGTLTLVAWRKLALSYDLVVLHGPTFLEALRAETLTAADMSFCVMDAVLFDVAGDAQVFRERLCTSIPESQRPRLFVSLLHKQSDPALIVASNLDRLTLESLCTIYAPEAVDMREDMAHIVAADGVHGDASGSEDDSAEPALSTLQDPVTGGVINLKDAIGVVRRLAARLGAHNSHSARPKFEFSTSTSSPLRVSCTVTISGCGSDLIIQGRPSGSEKEARRTACLELCIRLHRAGQLDYRLFPVKQTMNPPASVSTSSDPPGESDAGVSKYPRHRIGFWNHKAGDWQLYPSVIAVDGSDELGVPRRPMLLLTHATLPALEPIDIYFDGHPATVRVHSSGLPFQLESERLTLLHRYTIRIARAVSNKPMACALEQMPYFLAPWDPSFMLDDGLVPDRIPWDTEVQEGASGYITAVPQEMLSLASPALYGFVLQDRWAEYTRRFRAVAIRHDMNPSSRPPPNAAGVQHASFLEQYVSRLRTPFAGLKNENQPLIEVARIPGLVNRLFPASRAISEEIDPPKFIIPEVCARFVIPASTFETAYLVPCCLRRIEDTLLVKLLNHQFFDNEIEERLLLSAISSPSLCGDLDYQRLELLGDSVLKFLASAALFVRKPTSSESELHLGRQNIFSNRALTQAARRAGLPPFILTKPFSIKSWIPPNYDFDRAPAKPLSEEDALIPEKVAAYKLAREREQKADAQARVKRQQDASEHWIGEKTIADVTEAILGAAFLTGGKNLVLRAAKRLAVKLQDYVDVKANIPGRSHVQLRCESLEHVERLLGRPIQRPHLVAQALTHSVIDSSLATSYQRLEFLGDAILDLLVVRYIWRYEKLDPEALTLLKAAMVSNSTLAAVCVQCGLHKHIIHASPSLGVKIDNYVKALHSARDKERALAQSEVRQPVQYWLELEHPKPLSDLIESLLGALFISENYAIAPLEAFFENVLRLFYDEHIRLSSCSSHPTTTLFKMLESRSCQRFEMEKTTQKAAAYHIDGKLSLTSAFQDYSDCAVVVIHDTVLASATGSNKGAAARKASFEALLALERDPGFLVRTCDCRATLASKKQAKQAERAAKAANTGGKKKGVA